MCGVWVGVWGWGCGCVRPGIQSEDQNQFFTFKVRTFWQSEVKISVLALWLCALSSLFHNMGVGGYGRNPLFVRARHVQRCVKKCPHFECVIHRFVLALNAGTNTLYTRVYIVSSLWMPGQVGVCVCVWKTNPFCTAHPHVTCEYPQHGPCVFSLTSQGITPMCDCKKELQNSQWWFEVPYANLTMYNLHISCTHRPIRNSFRKIPSSVMSYEPVSIIYLYNRWYGLPTLAT